MTFLVIVYTLALVVAATDVVGGELVTSVVVPVLLSFPLAFGAFWERDEAHLVQTVMVATTVVEVYRLVNGAKGADKK